MRISVLCNIAYSSFRWNSSTARDIEIIARTIVLREPTLILIFPLWWKLHWWLAFFFVFCSLNRLLLLFLRAFVAFSVVFQRTSLSSISRLKLLIVYDVATATTSSLPSNHRSAGIECVKSYSPSAHRADAPGKTGCIFMPFSQMIA